MEESPIKAGDKKLETQDPLIEVNLGSDDDKRLTYISARLSAQQQEKLKELLTEYKDCFTWNYEEMSCLSRKFVEYRLPIKTGYKPYKQPAHRFESSIVLQIKNEIESLLKVGFIRAARYVDWVSNIVLVQKKNGKLKVCIDFRNLNMATPKDEYPMPIADMLVDSTAGHEILSFIDEHAGYNQIFIAEEDIAKTAFRCPGSIGTFEWVVMPFGLKNAGATYQKVMNFIFHDLISRMLKVYIDNIIVKSKS
uniref:Reverse transcriptase domain-containing protein n=1 Tax=Ananas comosus var. bracteatus TaxID=296719 RepID=A0A6V7P2M9_ANACO|nr:unnamed protein product [Ananas comosus var. bracteatus]